jgi:hypothetical protein
MLSISTLAESLAELNKRTGREWTESELFDLVTKNGIRLNAAPPITAETTTREFVIGDGLVEVGRKPPGHYTLAVLFPFQVAQLWASGETTTSHPKDKNYNSEGPYTFYTEPVRVTPEQVRIRAETLKMILKIWDDAQAGRGKWYVGPEWMFLPTEADTAPQAAPAQQADTEPAPGVAVPASEPPQWKMRIQIEAAAHMKTLRGSGASPTVNSIVKWMAKWCREQDVKTDSGNYPSARYLQTHVLGGAHWTPPR